MRKIYRHCASCKKEIFDGEEYILETDKRGIVNRMYHKKCVLTRKASQSPNETKGGEQ